MKNKSWFKRERSMRLSTLKSMQKKFDSRKGVDKKDETSKTLQTGNIPSH